MSNENNAQPAPKDIIRSMMPYLFAGKTTIEGTISVQETDAGFKFAIYTPPGYHASVDDYPILYGELSMKRACCP